MFTQWLGGCAWTTVSLLRLPYMQWLRGHAWTASSLFRGGIRAIAAWAWADGRFAA